MANMWTWEGVHSRSWLERPMISAVGNIADQLLHHSDLVKNELVASLPKHAWSWTPDAGRKLSLRSPSFPPGMQHGTDEGRHGGHRQAVRVASSGDATTALMFLLRHWRLIASASVRPSVDSGADSSVQPPPTDTACFNSKQAKDRDISKGAAWDISRLRNGCGLWFSCSL